MYLIVDFERDRQTVGIIERSRVASVTASSKGGGFGSLEKAIREFDLGGTAQPEGVVVHVGFEGRDVTWSTVRSATAYANALAFAWGVPVTAVTTAPEAGEDLWGFCRTKLSAANSCWAAALYNGEPNITSPKP